MDDPWRSAPPISDALIAYLEKKFPDEACHPTEDAAVHYGSVTVVRHLKAVKANQEEDPTYVPT